MKTAMQKAIDLFEQSATRLKDLKDDKSAASYATYTACINTLKMSLSAERSDLIQFGERVKKECAEKAEVTHKYLNYHSIPSEYEVCEDSILQINVSELIDEE